MLAKVYRAVKTMTTQHLKWVIWQESELQKRIDNHNRCIKTYRTVKTLVWKDNYESLRELK